MRPKAYIASPFFNDQQCETVTDLESLLGQLDYEVYSPSREGIVLKPDSPAIDRMRVLTENIENIDKSNLIVANTDGDSIHTILSAEELDWCTSNLPHVIWRKLTKLISRDPGTVWELGYGFGSAYDYSDICRVILTYSSQGFNINVMMRESVSAHAKSKDLLNQMLVELRPAFPWNAQFVEDFRKRYYHDYKVF